MVFSTLQQSFSFHASPEAFISSHRDTPQQDTSSIELDASKQGDRFIARAQILNRNVHIVSDYDTCQSVLQKKPGIDQLAGSASTQTDADAVFAVGPAYRELMADFFPAPNILLEDGKEHAVHKQKWMEQLANLPSNSEAQIRSISQSFIQRELKQDSTLDLYESLKTLSWELLLGVFLNLEKGGATEKKFVQIEQAQETLLRGQFSLFPVSVSVPFWQSARSRGIKAKKELQAMLKSHIYDQASAPDSSRCPMLDKTSVELNDIASHALLYTSSIANKALSSLLTASMMNLFLRPNSKQAPLVQLIRSQPPAERAKVLKSVLFETERLSPPVIGVMRRAMEDTVLESTHPRHQVPKGDDIWLYFVSAARDPGMFDDPDRFHFDRYMHGEIRPSITFGAGLKNCLGSTIVRHMIKIVAEELLNASLELEGEVSSAGVRGWLGWEGGSRTDQDFGHDMKQLPCQRPREPIMVTVRYFSSPELTGT